MKQRFLVFLAILGTLSWASAALAQGPITGTLEGVLKDPEGGVLPGALVTVSSPALVQGQLRTVTDLRGQFRFPALPPGLYLLQAELTGFRPLQMEGVKVNLGQTTRLDLTLELQATAEEVTVVAESPLVNVAANDLGASFDLGFITQQPVTRNYYAIVKAAPGVNMDYMSGSGSAVLAYGGTESRQNAFNLDGVNVADTAGGQHWVLPAIQWMQEIQISGPGAPAEFGGYTGGVINGVTRSGGNTFSGDLELIYGPKDWVSDNDPTTPNDEFRFTELALSLGGPIQREKVWFFASANYWNEITTPYGAVSNSERTIPRFLGKITWAPNPNQRFMVMSAYDRVDHERRGVGRYTLPEASSKQEAPEVSFAAHWEAMPSADSFLNLKLTGYDGRDDYLPYRGLNLPGRVDDGNTGIAWQNQEIHQFNHRSLVNLDGAYTWYRAGLFGTEDAHTVKVGFHLERGRSSDVWRRNGGFTYYDDSSLCASWDAYRANPACGAYFITRGYGEYNSRPKFSGLALFAQDSLKFRNFTVNAGLRWGNYQGGWQKGHGRSKVYDENYLDPRIGIVWDPFDDGRTAVKLHWGRYHEKMFGYLFDREASGNGVIPNQDCYWDPRTRGYTDCTTPAVKLARMGDLEHPYADEAVVSLERQLTGKMALGVDYINRKFRKIIAMVNVNEDYQLLTAPNNPLTGRDLQFWNLLSPPVFVLQTVDGAYRNYESVMLRLDKRYSGGFWARASVVWTDLEGNSMKNNSYEYEFEDRNGFINAEGKLDRFSEWEYKLSASVDLPFNLTLSGYATYLSGWYWTPYVRVRGLRYNATTGNYIWLTPRGSQQLPDRKLFDLRLAWTGKLAGTKLTVALEGFNITNEDTVLRVSSRWGDYRISNRRWTPSATYGQPTRIERPREVRASVRLEF
ncbi:MAG: carboxypeptidase regulatory-like domain-containing protein [Thermoanaerobaculum sp.]|nr:carboxypeptidase regulatory-like domain-containing protein [Thermoanaerobaculum sp.]